MQRRLLLPLMLCPLVLLGGCWNGRLLLFFEQPYWVAQGEDRPLRVDLERQALLDGYFPTLVVAAGQEDPSARLARELSRRSFSVVLIGPLLSLNALDLVRRAPQSTFILVGGSPRDDLPPNGVQLLFDRGPAFRAAGFAAGVAVRGDEPAASGPALSARVALLVLSSLAADGEAQAFASGVGEALDGAQPPVNTVAEPADRGAVQSTLQQMRRDGVEIFLLHLGSLDAYGLQVLQAAGGSAVVADWESSQPNPQAVFLSVEEDLPGGVSRALSAAKGSAAGASSSGSAGAAASGARIVQGPVRVIAGKARPIPEPARGRLEGR